MTCRCPGNICTCDGTPKLKDCLAAPVTIHIPLLMKDSAMTTTISEKRDVVRKAYGEAAVRKIAEAGGKSAEYKAAYAEKAGELFVQNRDDRFIEGFYESLVAGKSVDEIDALATGGTGKTGDRATLDGAPTADMTLDEAVKLPRYAGMWPSQAQQYAARDLALAKLGPRGSAGYREGVRDAFVERLSDAWKGEDAANENRRTTDAATAHDAMVSDLNDAWKR